jgi:hypothetical protein
MQLAGLILDTGATYEGMNFRSDDLGESLNAIREKAQANVHWRVTWSDRNVLRRLGRLRIAPVAHDSTRKHST